MVWRETDNLTSSYKDRKKVSYYTLYSIYPPGLFKMTQVQKTLKPHKTSLFEGITKFYTSRPTGKGLKMCCKRSCNSEPEPKQHDEIKTPPNTLIITVTYSD